MITGVKGVQSRGVPFRSYRKDDRRSIDPYDSFRADNWTGRQNGWEDKVNGWEDRARGFHLR